MPKKNKYHRPELMCPVHDGATLRACGAYADAVYFSVDRLSLRANANGITLKNLGKFIRECHRQQLKAYLAVNSVVYDNDLILAEKIIRQAKKSNIDAVIVWDPAVIELAKKYRLKFFISTQANVSNSVTAKFYQKIGATRVIAAREMTLTQIKNLKKKVKIEVESFVHGAMCYAISGRCLMSAYLYHKSANCGSCAQPCRKAWTIIDDEGHEIVVEGKYLMSAKDLWMIAFVPELIKAGIDSWKIEGRRRDPLYVATTAQCYREAIDAFFTGTFTKEKVARWQKKLAEVYNRGFFTGFYFGNPLSEGINFDKSDNSSTVKKVLVGQIVHYYSKSQAAAILLQQDNLSVGEIVVIEGKNTYLKQIVDSLEDNGKKINQGKKKEEVAMKVVDKVRPGDRVYVLR